MTEDTRNVNNKYKGWLEDLIREDVSKNAFPYAVMMTQLNGDFNFGSVVRSANALGASEVFYYGKKKWDRRSSVGTHHYTNVINISSLDELKVLKNKYVFVALENNANKPSFKIKDYSWAKNSLILIGEENSGLPQEIIDLCDHLIEIEMFGSVRSFNAAVAASIAMYDYVVKY